MKKKEKRNLVFEGANVAQDYKEDKKQSCEKERKLRAYREAPVLILIVETGVCAGGGGGGEWY
jgi:hypothetical protein